MGYIASNLMPGEKVLYQTRIHGIIFVWPAVTFVISIVLTVLLAPLGILIMIVAVIAGLSALVTYLTSEFALTDKRVIGKTGFIRRHSIELLLSKVEAISVDQGIMGRIFGYGTITVTGSGGTKDPFAKIINPLEFRRRTQEQVEIVQKAGH